jgi:hypothetical protein
VGREGWGRCGEGICDEGVASKTMNAIVTAQDDVLQVGDLAESYQFLDVFVLTECMYEFVV